MNFDLIAFDADDTLWHNERLYRAGRDRFRGLLEKYQITDASDEQVDVVEMRNLPYYGYGVMSFVLSLIESGIQLTGGQLTSSDVQALIEMGKEMLDANVEIYDQVESTLDYLHTLIPLMLITKGEPNNQLAKIARSGIAHYFQHIEVVHDKRLETYSAILGRAGVLADRFLMVGNSLRSDILPVLQLGGWAVYIPNEITWAHEQVEPPEQEHPRLFEITQIGHLPDLILKINSQA